jgi:hypothetical protein
MGWAQLPQCGTDGAMALHAVTVDVTLAVKNGPLGMWRALGPTGPIRPLGRLITSPFWLVATICVSLALAPPVYRATQARRVPPSAALLLATAALGLFVVFDLLTRRTGFPLLVFVLLPLAWSVARIGFGLGRTLPILRPAERAEPVRRPHENH